MKPEKIPGFRKSENLSGEDSWILRNFSPYIRQSGNQWRPRWKMGNRKLLDYLLVFIASGEGVFSLDKQPFPVTAGDAVLIPPDTLHEMSGTSEKMHCIYLHFDLIYGSKRSHWDACIPGGTKDLSAFREFMHPKLNNPFWAGLKGKLPLVNPNSLRALMLRICSLHTSGKADNAVRVSGIMFELLEEIKEQVLENENQKMLNHGRLLAAGRYITEHPDIVINIKKLAERSGFSESHFRRLFRQVHGLAPKTMHLQARIRKACEFLTYWDMNVSETAEKLNFPSIHAFSRTFRNVTGVSPLQYRKISH